jgi:hypothetical protein
VPLKSGKSEKTISANACLEVTAIGPQRRTRLRWARLRSERRSVANDSAPPDNWQRYLICNIQRHPQSAGGRNGGRYFRNLSKINCLRDISGSP